MFYLLRIGDAYHASVNLVINGSDDGPSADRHQCFSSSNADILFA